MFSMALGYANTRLMGMSCSGPNACKRLDGEQCDVPPGAGDRAGLNSVEHLGVWAHTYLEVPS